MKWIIWVLLCMFAVTFSRAEDGEGEGEETSQDSVGQSREHIQENWRALETYPDAVKFDWISQDQLLENKPRRRRLRKRKRRPQIYAPPDQAADESYVERPVRRRVRLRPRLQHSPEPWDEMKEDAEVKPNVRRRLTPAYYPPADSPQDARVSSTTTSFPEERIVEDDPTEDRNDTEPLANPIAGLKSLLKQSGGGLSLSEVLQQKNLSLIELLSGSEKAISALTEKPQTSTEQIVVSSKSSEPEETTRYTNQPISDKKTTDRIYVQENDSSETLLDKTEVDVRKRLPIFNYPRDNKLYPTLTKLDVITEATTERRIFVPSHPKYYTSLNFKPEFSPEDEAATDTNTETTTTTEKPKPTFRPRGRTNTKLPITNAKSKFSAQITVMEQEEIYPAVESAKINISQVFGRKDQGKEVTPSTDEKEDKPLRVPIDLTVVIDKTEVNPATDLPVENMTYVTAREEIMEILKDPSSRQRLSRILETRNMTVEELVEQRERGSSQLHLADIFHNKTREPEPKEEPFVGHIEGSVDTKFFERVVERQQKSQKLDSNGSSSEPTSQVPVTVDSSKAVDNRIEHHSWTRFRSEVIPVLPTENDENDRNIPQLPFSDEDHFFREIPRLETIDDNFSLSSNEQVNVDETNPDQEVFLRIPSGVKSAVFVSLAIIGLSMLVFLTILVIFRWVQRQTRSINYCSRLSSKIRSPIMLQVGPTHAIKTFMSETLGRKKNYYKNNVQRMCDDIWEGGGGKKLSF